MITPHPRFANVRLGLLPKRAADKHLVLARYLKPEALPPAPTAWDGYQGGKAAPKLYLNDRYGCCTIAGLANHARLQAAIDKRPLPEYTDPEIKAYYFHLTQGADSGLIETDVLDYACRTGFPADGRTKFRTRVTVDPANAEHMQLAAALFGGLYLGLGLPARAQAQGEHWAVEGDGATGDDAPWSWGGHCAILAGYDRTPSQWDKPGQLVGNVSILTWGEVVYATRHWLSTYCDEAYAIVDEAHLAMPWIDGQALLDDAAELQA